MKKLVSIITLFCFLLSQNAVFASNIKVYADRLDGYGFKTVTKKEVKFETEKGEIKSLLKDEDFYKKVRKREVGRYFWVGLPCALIGGFITGASFFILTIPGIGIAFAGSLPYMNATKYNSKLAQEFYIDNSRPLNLDPKAVKNTYVFLPKNENVSKIL